MPSDHIASGFGFAFACIPSERHLAPLAERADSLEDALRAIDAAFAQGRFAAKERVDLAALARRTGCQPFAQNELVPDELFAELRAEHALATIVLWPGVDRSESVLACVDGCAALKGLPENERATRLAAACGVPTAICGPCYLLRVKPDTEWGGLGLSVVDFAPSEIASRELLEQAQAANVSSAADGVRDAAKAAMDLCVSLLVKTLAASHAHAPPPLAQAEAAAQPLAGGTADTPESTLEKGAEGAAAVGGDAPPAVEAEVMQWADAQDEVTVTVTVPARTSKADISCSIRQDALTLEVRTLPEGYQSVVNARLFQRIDVDDSNWSLESLQPGKSTRTLVMTLTKEKKMRWLTLTRSG